MRSVLFRQEIRLNGKFNKARAWRHYVLRQEKQHRPGDFLPPEKSFLAPCMIMIKQNRSNALVIHLVYCESAKYFED